MADMESNGAGPSGGIVRSLLLLTLLAALTVGLAFWGKQSSRPIPEPERTDAPEVEQAKHSAEEKATDGAAEKSPVQRLVGRWQRLDNPSYAIQIRSVGSDGKLDAGYFNPNPIHVERAVSQTANGTLRVFVVLRDTNYPGATYDLTYDPKSDQLSGEYNQPLVGEVYQIAFARAAD